MKAPKIIISMDFCLTYTLMILRHVDAVVCNTDETFFQSK